MDQFNITQKETECLKCKNCRLVSAVRRGRLELVKELVSSVDPSCLKEWPEGNLLLRDAFHKNREIAKVLLLNGFKVDNDSGLSHTPLHDAVIYGDVEIVEMLLSRNANINAKDAMWGQTSLHHAIEMNKIEMVKLLLNRGASVDASDRDGRTPLHYAVVTRGGEKLTKLLLQYKPNVNIIADCGTALHIAVKQGKLQIISDLLNQGANINAVCTSTGYTPLHIASAKGGVDVAELLLMNGADINAMAKSNLSPLYMATDEGSIATVKLLLQNGAEVDAHNENGRTALYCAVKRGYSGIVREILKFSPHLHNKSNRSCLYSAVNSNYRNIVDSLVEYGFGVRPKDTNNCKLLHSAVKFGYLSIVESLLHNGKNINMKSKSKVRHTLLHTAVIYEQMLAVHYLIQGGANVNAKDAIKRTPLFYAVQNGDLNITKLLLANGAVSNSEVVNTAVGSGRIEIVRILLQRSPDININRKDKFGSAALHISAQKGHEIITRMLLDDGAIINAKKKNGKTALHIATLMGHTKVVKMLMEDGAEVNSKTHYDTTPLHVATKRHYLEIVNILIKFGADVDARDVYGRTPLHIACQLGNESIIAALLRNGSDINKSKVEAINYALTNMGLFCLRISLGYYCSYRRDNANIVVRHIAKLMAKKSFVRETHLKTIRANPNLRQYYIMCEREIQNMKNEKIHNTSVSYYNILVKGVHQLSMYAKNEDIVEAFETRRDVEMFPIYFDVLEDQFRVGQERQCCLKSSTESFDSVFGYSLPDLLVNKILNYLSNSELKNLVNACPYDVCDDINTIK